MDSPGNLMSGEITGEITGSGTLPGGPTIPVCNG